MAQLSVQGHAEVLEHLYRLFHGVVDVHARLVDFLRQLQEGFYIQCSVQSLMLVTAPYFIVLKARSNATYLLTVILCMMLQRGQMLATPQRHGVAWYVRNEDASPGILMHSQGDVLPPAEPGGEAADAGSHRAHWRAAAGAGQADTWRRTGAGGSGVLQAQGRRAGQLCLPSCKSYAAAVCALTLLRAGQWPSVAAWAAQVRRCAPQLLLPTMGQSSLTLPELQ